MVLVEREVVEVEEEVDGDDGDVRRRDLVEVEALVDFEEVDVSTT